MNFYKNFTNEFIERCEFVFGSPKNFVPLHEPEFLGNEKKYVEQCIETGWVSSVGEFVNRFESAVAEACGTKYGIAVVNGTAALELSLKLAGVRAGDEVLIPSLTFVATANATSHINAIPHFIDSCEMTLGIDPEVMRNYIKRIARPTKNGLINRETGRRIACVVPMHVFGHPVDMLSLISVCEELDIPIVEDAAESLGSKFCNKRLGSFGKLAAVSFNGNKIITTGGGGAIVTNDPNLAAYAKHLSTTAKIPHQWEFFHDEIAYNYRLPNINAALGLAQLEQLQDRVLKKRKLASKYIYAFDSFKGGGMFSEVAGAKSNYWLNTFILAPTNTVIMRNELLNGLNDANIMARPVWKPLHTLPIYSHCPRAPMPITECLENRIINLPSSAKLAEYT